MNESPVVEGVAKPEVGEGEGRIGEVVSWLKTHCMHLCIPDLWVFLSRVDPQNHKVLGIRKCMFMLAILQCLCS